MNGILIINKPKGYTSHDVVNVLRKKLNIRQISADLSYFTLWWNSKFINKDLNHLPPHPAGYDTVDVNSNNCPIPYVRVITVVHGDDSIKHDLLVLLLMAYGDFTSLKSLTIDPIELKAIGSYLSYLATTITENGGTVPSKDNDDPEPDEPITDTLILNLYLRTEDGAMPTAVHFGSNDYWFSIVKDQRDADKLNSLGHEVVYSRDIGFGCLKYSRDEFNYEIIDIYDEDGHHVDDYGNTQNNLYVSKNNDSVLTICTRDTPINTLCYTWGLKITKKGILLLWTTIDGNVNAAVDSNAAWALFESDGSGNSHLWGTNEYEIIDYAYYRDGSNTLSWQGSSVANNYWQLVKGSDGDIRVKGNDGINNVIAAIKLQTRSLSEIDVYINADKTVQNIKIPRLENNGSESISFEWFMENVDRHPRGDTAFSYPLYDSDGQPIRYDRNKKFTITWIKTGPQYTGYAPSYKSTKGVPFDARVGGSSAFAYPLINYNGVLALCPFYVGYYGMAWRYTTDHYMFKLKVEDAVEVLLWLKADKSSATFTANDYWFGYMRTDEAEGINDIKRVEDFGCITKIPSGSSNVKAIVFDDFNFEYELTGIYRDASSQTLLPGWDSGNFKIVTKSSVSSGANGDIMVIANTYSESKSTYRWSCRILKKTHDFLIKNVTQQGNAPYENLWWLADLYDNGAPVGDSTASSISKIYGFRLKSLPQYFLINFSENQNKSPAEFTDDNSKIQLRNITSSSRILSSLLNTSPSELEIFDVVLIGAPKQEIYKFYLVSENGDPLRIYASPSRSSEVLFETKDMYFYLYADTITTIDGSTWGYIKFIRDDEEFTGYVEADYPAPGSVSPYSTTINAPANLLTNYLPSKSSEQPESPEELDVEEIIAYVKTHGDLTEYVYLYSSWNLYSESGGRITTRPNCINIVEAVYTSAVGGGSWYDGWNLQEKLYMEYDPDGNLSIRSDNTGTGKRISAVKYLSIPYSCLLIDTVSEKTANREWNIGISYTYNGSDKLDLFAIDGAKFQFGKKTFGLRIQDYPIYYAIEYTNNNGRSPVSIAYSTSSNTLSIRNDGIVTEGCITPLFSTLPQSLKVIDIAPTSAPRVSMTRFVNGANRQDYPLCIYTSVSRTSEVLFETKDPYLTFYADVVTELAGSKWGRVKLKQNDQEFIGYVEAYDNGPIATDMDGVEEMLTNYLPYEQPESEDTFSGQLINTMVLPSTHAGSYTHVTFDSLRYYAKCAVHDIEKSQDYAATLTWTDASLGDLTGKITISKDSFNKRPQTVFRIIFIYESSISGASAYDGTNSSFSGYISSYTYNNGVHSIRFHYTIYDWTNYPITGRIQLRYLDGVTKFLNLDAFDLIDVYNGNLVLNTSSDRYDMYSVWGGSIDLHAEY